jgi:CPA1 family monovalent cation:H+ antiporter
MFKRQIVGISIMSVPVAVFSTMLIGVSVKVILGYDDYNWSEAFMLGALLSATDPDAIVDTLEDIGVSKNLSTLMSSEAVINDCSAFTMFIMFHEMTLEPDIESDEVVSLLFQRVFGGILIGLAFAIAMCEWLRRIHNDKISETVITFAFVYLSFWTAEVSGAE